MINKFDLKQLVAHSDSACVSLYLPTHLAGRARRQNGIRMRNLLRDARRQLDDQNLSEEHIAQLLSPLERRIDDEFWNRCEKGLAVFIASEFLRFYISPGTFPELCIVDDHFHVSPLAPMLQENRRFFILGLTKDGADLFEATRNTLAECDLPKLAPVVLDGTEKALQFHSHQTSSHNNHGASDTAIFHGHGGTDDREKVDIENFYKRQVAPEIAEALKDEDAPLVLACVDYLAPIYRSANQHPKLIDGHVSGSPDEFSEEVLRESAWQLVSPLIKETACSVREKFDRLAGGSRATDAPEPVVDAARNGRVETLLVSKEVAARTGRSTDRLPADETVTESVEEAIECTWRNGGQVLALESMPGNSPLAAVLRY
jgi:hypothetical protein